MGKGWDKFAGFMANPISGIMGSQSKKGREAREATYAKPQYYGGSPDAAAGYRQAYQGGRLTGQGYLEGGLSSGQGAVRDTEGRLFGASQSVDRRLSNLGANQAGLAQRSEQGFDQRVAGYDQSRGLLQGAAGQLQGMAQSAPSEYMRTDQAAFAANQDAAQRAALSIGAQGGASGVRAALAGSQDANAAAAQQAQMVRANEYNQLLANRQAAVGQAANIYSGMGAQDQALAGMMSGRQQQAVGQQASLLGAQGNLALGQGQLGVSQAGQGVNAGVSTQGQYLGAETAANTAELQANQANEEARMKSAKEAYKSKFQPIKSALGM